MISAHSKQQATLPSESGDACRTLHRSLTCFKHRRGKLAAGQGFGWSLLAGWLQHSIIIEA